MKTINDGGPAFPLMPPLDQAGQSAYGYPFPDNGMTLCDWFAGQALSSIMQDKAIWDCTADERRDIAERMYQWARAMVAAKGSA